MGEEHADELKAKAALYLKWKSKGRGLLRGKARHSAQRLVDQAAGDVRDPETVASDRDGRSPRCSWRAQQPDATEDARQQAKRRWGGDFPIGAMGSAPTTPFVQHLGVTSITLEYGGEGEQQGVYHSQYDTYRLQPLRRPRHDLWRRPGGDRGADRAARRRRRRRAAAVRRLVANVAENIDELHRLVPTHAPANGDHRPLVNQNAFALAADPTRTSAAPPRKDAVPNIDLGPAGCGAPPACATARRTTIARSPRRARSRRSVRRGWTPY